ncbi:DUF3732 domain-containing protein [Vibrio cholerae]|uniref:DUF3732 domain-containing protein n=1 Tax=Vibrio cholerae TaxID=666 RepID=UPI001B82AE8A|nr:DUF3732 domain-containing protein [Vibrio cholerae]
MQIEKIIVYGKNGKRNDVSFKTGTLNILTGASKRGKSQLIEIIDYCFGSDCNVAAGLITDLVAWYAILLDFGDSKVFIARQSPTPGFNSSATCDLRVGRTIDIPEFEQLNDSTTPNGVTDYLSRKLGIGHYTTEVPIDQTRSSFSVGFKHSKTYIFQAQDELASKRILFHRQSEPYIPQFIKDTMPYFMGASDEKRIKDLDTLRRIKQERNKLNKKINEVEQLKGEGLEKGRLLLVEAFSCGLTEVNARANDNEIIKELRRLAEIVSVKTEQNNSDSDGDAFDKLEKDRDIIREKKQIIRAKINSIKRYHKSLSKVDDEFEEQYLRLESIKLYSKLKNDDVKFVEPLGYIKDNIQRNAENLKLDLDGLKRTRPKLTSALTELEKEDNILAEELGKIRLAIQHMLQQKAQLEKIKELEFKKTLVIGRISLYLESINWNRDTKNYKDKLQKLDQEIEELERSLDPSGVLSRLESQLSCVSEDMTKWARELKLEHSQYPIRLDPKLLTVVADTPNGRTPLYKMGSGANWVGYHLVTYVALAKWFIEQSRPVPRFIFFDQPTQVFFPSDLDRRNGDVSEIKLDEDRIAVIEMFKWLAKVSQEIGHHLQIIVTDHADINENWFQKYTVNPKWRGNNALIPQEWIPKGYDFSN